MFGLWDFIFQQTINKHSNALDLNNLIQFGWTFESYDNIHPGVHGVNNYDAYDFEVEPQYYFNDCQWWSSFLS